MTQLTWDGLGERFYETGVDRGVLYVPDNTGVYSPGVAWNGLITLTETPSGAAATPQFADNIKYLNIIAAEQFGGTIDAFTYPAEFEQFDGVSTPTPGVLIGQQARKPFGLSYRTRKGNDLEGDDYAYKLHLMYGISAAPSQKAYGTVNDTPAPIAFSWTIDTTPVAVSGMRPTSLVVIDSSEVDPTALAALETIIYGTTGVDPLLPLPDAVVTLFEGSVVTVTPLTVPTYNTSTHVLTIPTQTGIKYYVGGVVKAAGTYTFVTGQSWIVTAHPDAGYVIGAGNVNEWEFNY